MKHDPAIMVASHDGTAVKKFHEYTSKSNSSERFFDYSRQENFSQSFLLLAFFYFFLNVQAAWGEG